MNDDDVAQTYEQLTALLAAIDAGEIEATREEAAYIAGAAATLGQLRDRPAGR